MFKQFEYDDTDPRTYEEQYEAWKLCADTLECDITTYPGSAEEQQSVKQTPNVITKKSRSQ